MTTGKKLLAGASMLATIMATTPAFAAGTPAGTTIQNTVTVDYKISGVSQNAVEASNEFTVDRKVNLTVAESGSSSTTVSPGQSNAVTTFTVTNNTNAAIDMALSATQKSSGQTAKRGGTDSFDLTGLKIYVDDGDGIFENNDDGDGTVEAGEDSLVTYLDQVAADATKIIFVVGNVPLGLAHDSVAGVRLTATSHEASASGSLGSQIAATSGANTSGVDTVLADTDSDGNTASDGVHFAEDDYKVSTAALTVTKTSKIISDPINLTTNPKMIPGAVVQYCIIVANASGAATATDVTISDTLPSETDYLASGDSSIGIKVDGTVDQSGNCNDDGDSGGSHSNGTISATLSDISGGVTRTVRFRVTVD